MDQDGGIVDKFICVPFDNFSDIAEHVTLSIDASSTSPSFLEQYQMFNADNMKMIMDSLGNGFANYGHDSNNEDHQMIPILHQAVVTMQHLRFLFERRVDFRSWTWLEDQMNKAIEPPPFNRPPHKSEWHDTVWDRKESCVISLYHTTHPVPDTARIFTTVLALQETSSYMFRCFPSATEWRQEYSKWGDLRALEEIASMSPSVFSCRPKSCFKHGYQRDERRDFTACVEDCQLKNINKIVMKRNYSCGGDHVKACEQKDAMLPWQLTNRGIYVWIGQEHIPFFGNHGEFRVFIAAVPAEDSLRGRTGEVIHTVITKWRKGNSGEMDTREPDMTDWASTPCHPLQQKQLDAFALYTYTKLRERDDWKEKYESLEVGVRLDVGIMVDAISDEKRFFVNEITRFWCADYFSQHTLGDPQQTLALAFSQAINNYFPAS